MFDYPQTVESAKLYKLLFCSCLLITKQTAPYGVLSRPGPGGTRQRRPQCYGPRMEARYSLLRWKCTPCSAGSVPPCCVSYDPLPVPVLSDGSLIKTPRPQQSTILAIKGITRTWTYNAVMGDIDHINELAHVFTVDSLLVALSSGVNQLCH